jgi:glucose dehydrogenase
MLVVPAWNGGIMGLDATTGAERWRHQPGTPRRGAITVANGRVWLMQQNLEVVGLDAGKGHVVARFALDIDLSSISSFAPRVLVMGNRLLAPFAMMLLGLDLTK